MDEQNLALVRFLKQQIMQQQQDDLNAAQLLLNLTSNSKIPPASSQSSSQTTKIIKSHPKFRAKVSQLLISSPSTHFLNNIPFFRKNI